LADPGGWVVYKHPDQLFSVRFPGKPVVADQSKQAAGTMARVESATFIDGDHALVATGGLYTSTAKFDINEAMDRMLNAWVARWKGRVIAQKTMTLDGFQGREVQFTAPGPYAKPLRATARVFASSKPPSSYLVIAFQMDGTPDANAPKFLDSLHLGTKVETKP
ncbi:MAG TPA: hypothetical protein VLM79_17495, partial [Kofleriaceae bacterium]|nr:hypothetical protein [Kofleriaceae bacterium]